MMTDEILVNQLLPCIISLAYCLRHKVHAPAKPAGLSLSRHAAASFPSPVILAEELEKL